MMITRYSVVAYYPDRLRGEFRNIGIVAWGSVGWAERLVPDLPRDLAEFAGVAVDEFHRRLNLLTPEERGGHEYPEEIAERMSGPYCSIAFRAPGASLEDNPAVLLERLWGYFCAPLRSPASGRWVWEAEPAPALTENDSRVG